MPKDKQNAIDKALKLGDTSNFEQIFYEGYAAHGIALMVETAPIILPNCCQRAERLQQMRR